MITRRRPSTATLLAVLDQVRHAAFTHQPIGSLRGDKLAGFQRDHARVLLGHGSAAFGAAKQSIRDWQMMPPMVTLVSRELALSDATVVGVLCRVPGMWTFNPCRVAYLIDDQRNGVQRYGFAYATLPGHIERGEEHFVCEWHQATDEVWYDLKADSRPQHPLARVGYLYARRIQRRFRMGSCQAMIQAVLGVR